MPSATSPRLTQTSTTDTLTTDSTEVAPSRSRISPSNQRSSRRSNSAMSTSRTRASATKEVPENEGEAQGNGESVESAETTKDATQTSGHEEEEEGEDNSGSGESSNSTTTTNTRPRRAVGGRRRRGGAGAGAAAASRARAAKASQSAVEHSTEDAKEGEIEASAIKSEADDDDSGNQQIERKPVSEAEDSSMSRSNSKDEDKRSRQRSVSGIKELAGLGLRSLGDGEEEPLIPRRTRRGAVSPQDGMTQPREGEEGDDQTRGEELKGEDDDTVLAGTKADSVDGEAAPEEEVGEEGVTRCLCGSSDENVGLMIQCETCKCWQHCICMGMRTEEDCPDVYFCEQCRPELHIALLRLLGVLPSSRQMKKGGSKTQSGRLNAKDAAKELKEAKEAVLSLAKENEKRRKEGREPVTGWSVAQEQEHQQQLQLQNQLQQNQGGQRSLSNGQHRRQPSETQVRSSRSQSRDEMNVPRSPPKRRSTMNSRDSAYGWESIPTHLLNADDDDEAREESEGGGVRKRKRGGPIDDLERQSPSPTGASSNGGDAQIKRRRTSSAMEGAEDPGLEAAEGEEEASEETTVAHSQGGSKKLIGKSRATRDQESKPKHPNQYTARRAAAAAAAAAAAGVGTGGSSSPSPSPSKHRMADGSRRATTLRDVMNNGSRMATPTPQNDYSKSSNPGAPWGMPDHLSHMAFLLPAAIGPEPLKVNMASTKGMPSTSNSKGAPSTAIKDSKTERITQASPQAYQVISLSEPNTKIKYPGKRTTMGEMKKRVRNILDFVSRLQIESAERERRMKFLGITKDDKRVDEGEQSVESSSTEGIRSGREQKGGVIEPAGEVQKLEVEQSNDQDTEMKALEGDNETSHESSSLQAPTTLPTSADSISPSTNPGEAVDSTSATVTEGNTPSTSSLLKPFTELHSTSMSLVDELTRELLAFQQRYGTGTSASAFMASSGGAY